MSKLPPVITIDGPSGCGKGTIAQLLAQQLAWHYLDSGALYRAVAFFAKQQHVTDELAIVELIKHIELKFISVAGLDNQVLLNGEDISMLIRSEEISQLASKIAALPQVRAALVDLQRSFRQAPGLVTDGRDMGSVIFPDAALKVFLTASREERAKRRYFQLQKQGANVTLSNLSDNLHERDARDTERHVAPTKPVADAIVIDSTNLSVDEVMQKVMELALMINV
jgi:cytidylate kinase